METLCTTIRLLKIKDRELEKTSRRICKAKDISTIHLVKFGVSVLIVFKRVAEVDFPVPCVSHQVDAKFDPGYDVWRALLRDVSLTDVPTTLLLTETLMGDTSVKETPLTYTDELEYSLFDTGEWTMI